MKLQMLQRSTLFIVGLGLSAGLSGCGGSPGTGGEAAVAENSVAASPNAAKRSFKPIAVGGQSGETDASRPKLTGAEREKAVKEALQPLQVVLGAWNGLTRKANAIDQPKWRWDWTDKEQPALLMESEKNIYFKSARLTYLPEEEAYQLTAVDPEGKSVRYVGTWLEPVRDVPGDDDKPQRTFKLELTEASPEGDGSKVVLNQQGNNRYLLEVHRRQGQAPPRLFDTVAAQRVGTSFAISDSDYGEQTCIVSEGLGTIEVSFNGKTYWVCCTGCKAAFEEEPDRWLALAAEREKEKMNKP